MYILIKVALEESIIDLMATCQRVALLQCRLDLPQVRASQHQSDKSNEVEDKLGLPWTMVDPLKSLYQQFGIDLGKFNGDESWTLSVPVCFIIGQDGVIKYTEFSIDYT